MAITTLDGVIAGAQKPSLFVKTLVTSGKLISTWGATGIPVAGSFNSTLAGGTYSSSGGLVPGQLPHFDPAGQLGAYLSRLVVGPMATGGTPGGFTYILADRLWDNGGINIASGTPQTVNSPTWPARSQFQGTAGIGVLLAVEFSVQGVTGPPIVTVSYTNSSATAGQSGSNTIALGNAVGTFYPISLQGSDVGVQSVQSLTLSGTALTAGTINLVAWRPLAMGWTNSAGGSLDCITGGFPALFNGAVPFLIVLPSESAAVLSVNGVYVETQG